MIVQLGIGVVIGIAFGAVAVWILDRRHQKTVEKLIESRRKIERQRTQAVNDLFAFRAEAGNLAAATSGMDNAAKHEDPNPELLAEMENLRALVARADSALASARVRRDEQEAELAQLRGRLEALTEDRADVINLHPQPPVAGYNVNFGQA